MGWSGGSEELRFDESLLSNSDGVHPDRRLSLLHVTTRDRVQDGWSDWDDSLCLQRTEKFQ